jgi:hypothetical protein
MGFIFHVAFALCNNPRAKFMYITHQRDLVREKINELHMVLAELGKAVGKVI